MDTSKTNQTHVAKRILNSIHNIGVPISSPIQSGGIIKDSSIASKHTATKDTIKKSKQNMDTGNLDLPPSLTFTMGENLEGVSSRRRIRIFAWKNRAR